MHHTRSLRTHLFRALLLGIGCWSTVALPAFSQQPKPPDAVRGSLTEDRAARKLLEAGDARLEADEPTKAVEIWQSVIERYPRSRVRYEAHMRLGQYLLERERAYDRARGHYEAAANEENSNQEQRADATLRMGQCFYEAGNFGKSFGVMRDVIEKFPTSPQVNHAYYYIGLGHYQLGHYSRAIDALEKVGTALSGDDAKFDKLEAGKRFFLKIEDADLAALEQGQVVQVLCKTTQGDEEQIACHPVGRNVRVVLGSIPTQLGKPKPKNGILEVRGDDKVQITYLDEHTSDRKFNQPRAGAVDVVGNGIVSITDGAFSETLRGVVLGREVNVQITDLDRDLTDNADTLEAVVEVYREKSGEELDAEAAKLAGEASASGKPPVDADLSGEEPEVNRWKLVDKVAVKLTEVRLPKQSLSLIPTGAVPETGDETAAANPAPAAVTPAPAIATGSPSAADGTAAEEDDGTLHSGVFRAQVPLVRAEAADTNDKVLQALPTDRVQVVYIDTRNTGAEERQVIALAKAMEGNLGGVRVTRADISDQELRVKTQLKTADALTNIGNRYKEFGLKKNADGKYGEALKVCEEITVDAQRLGGRLLEETYVQLWQIYYEMDRLELAAAMCQRLQREFPNSAFVDDALLQLADVVRKQGELQRAIGIYGRLVQMPTSQLRGEAQFGIAECYEQLASKATGPGAAQLFDRSFQEYKKVFEHFPESGRVGEAVAKMANYYYQQKDYARAVDIFDTVLSQHPDAKFLDVILFNYGRCLYRMDRKAEARKQFDQLIADFPESPLAADAKKIAEALAKSGF